MASRELLQESAWHVAVAWGARKGRLGPKRTCWDQKLEWSGNGPFQRETKSSSQPTANLGGGGAARGTEGKKTGTKP